MNIAQREEAYRFFIADGIKFLTENTAGMTKGGTYLSKGLRDIIYPKPNQEEPAETRSCEEIVRDMWTRPTTPKKGG